MRLRALLSLAPLALLAVAAALVMQPVGCNQTAHYALVKSLAERSATIDRYAFQSCDTAWDGEHFTIAKAPGLALFSEPWYWLLRKAGAADDWQQVVNSWPEGMLAVPREAIWRVGLVGAVLPFLALLVLMRWAAEKVVPGRGTTVTVLLGGGTLLLPFATLYFSHVLSATLAFAAFAVAFAERRAGPGRRTLLRLAAAGALAGLAVTAELPLAVTVAFVLLYALWGPGRRPAPAAALAARGVALAAGALAGLAPLLVYNAWAYGSPLRLSYRNAVIDPGRTGHDVIGANASGFFGVTHPRLHDLVELLLSGRGLLTLAPVVAAAVPGAVLLWRRGLQAEALLIGGIAAALLLYVSAYWVPFGGWVPGPRFLIPLLPFLALPVAAALERAPLAVGAAGLVSILAMTLATVAEPLLPTDHTWLWLHRLGNGDFTHTVVTSLGGGHGWGAIVPVLACIAAAVALAGRGLAGRTGAGRPAATLAAASIAAWLVLLASTPELLRSDRAYGGATGVVAALAVVTALAAALVLVPRRGLLPVAAALPLAAFAWPELGTHRAWSLALALGVLGLLALIAGAGRLRPRLRL